MQLDNNQRHDEGWIVHRRYCKLSHKIHHFNSFTTFIDCPTGVFPIVNADGSLNYAGAQRRAGFLEAIKEINNKTDGIYDDVLPNVYVKMAVRDSHVTFSNTVLATLDMTNNVFKPHGVHGVIGAAIDSVTEAIAGILAGVDLPQIACKFMQSFLRLLKIIFQKNI